MVSSRAFIPFLSLKSMKSNHCKDEIALAAISDKPMFPVRGHRHTACCRTQTLLCNDHQVVIGDLAALQSELSFATKLTLSACQWTSLPGEYQSSQDAQLAVTALADNIKKVRMHATACKDNAQALGRLCPMCTSVRS